MATKVVAKQTKVNKSAPSAAEIEAQMAAKRANMPVTQPNVAQAASVQGVNTTATVSGNASVTPRTAEEAFNSQSGGTGNANINPYHNAFEAYQTSMNKVKDAQTGQLNTEYNNQQKQIEGAYQNLNRNAYVTYMQRQLQNRNAASNMGTNRTGAAENINTANMVDYNRSVGNLGAYRQTQLSNAENAYNSNLANINNEFDTNMAERQMQYENMGIQRQQELEDLQTNLDFQAKENALDRAQTAKDANRAYQQKKYDDRFSAWSDTIGRYDTVAKADKAIKKLQQKKKAGTLSGWQKEYYTEMLNYLRAQRTVARKNKKK